MSLLGEDCTPAIARLREAKAAFAQRRAKGGGGSVGGSEVNGAVTLLDKNKSKKDKSKGSKTKERKHQRMSLGREMASD